MAELVRHRAIVALQQAGLDTTERPPGDEPGDGAGVTQVLGEEHLDVRVQALDEREARYRVGFSRHVHFTCTCAVVEHQVAFEAQRVESHPAAYDAEEIS